MSEVINLNSANPAAPTGKLNVAWQMGASTGTDPAAGLLVYPVTASVPVMVGDTGAGGVMGLAPAPAAGDAAAGKVLKADGTWGVVFSAPVTPTGTPNGVLTSFGLSSAPSYPAN